jgi:hypothetical protein
MSARARRKNRNHGLKKGFRRENGPTPRHKVRDLRDAVDTAAEAPWTDAAEGQASRHTYEPGGNVGQAGMPVVEEVATSQTSPLRSAHRAAVAQARSATAVPAQVPGSSPLPPAAPIGPPIAPGAERRPR